MLRLARHPGRFIPQRQQLALSLCKKPFSSVDAGDEYERKTPHEHVLLRPGMYIGQVAPSATENWVFDPVEARMVKRGMNYSPALLKLFDEILVNAADNAQRKEKMSKINVSIDKNGSGDGGSGVEIRIRNDGKVIPIVKHSKEGMYIPELIFGNLLTGSNFDDSKDAYTGGRHGYGAKLTNIFSHRFTVEMYDTSSKTLYKQNWSDNMFECEAPTLEQTDLGSENYLEIRFTPDLTKLGLDEAGVDTWMREKQQRIEEGKEKPGPAPLVSPLEDTLTMMRRRTYDVAACIGTEKQPIAVTLNEEVVPVTDFQDYVNLFKASPEHISAEAEAGAEIEATEAMFATTANKQWEVAVMGSSSGSFENQSFVNSVWTPRGGTHVAVVTLQVVNAIEEALLKRGHAPTPHMIRNHLMVFVKARVSNPTFDSQAKDALSTSPSQLQREAGGLSLPPAFLKRVVSDSGIVDEILIDLEARERSKLVRASSLKGAQKNLTIPKLEDALYAGTSRAGECSLILTEGDSAKALAVAGLEVVGRERYGILPLRGKILNVRGVTASTLNKNTELMNLTRALGLEFGKKYSGRLGDIVAEAQTGALEGEEQQQFQNGVHGQGLRYGKVLIMTDQDHDGSHIKGLLINFFHHYWPSLLDVEGFLQQFITPLVKVRRKGAGAGKAKTGKDDAEAFYSLPEYDQWTREQGTDASKYTVKYYKGLGTNTAAEGRAYFADLDSHRKLFWSAREDGAGYRRDANSVDLAFSKHRAGDRKEWLENHFDPKAYVDPYKKHVAVTEFINTDLMQFSQADNVRSIPSVVDGLKPSQRKVLYGCLKKKGASDTETKVVQLAGYIAEQTAYHHGEGSLHTTIVNMAQEYVGANNVPLLNPGGQFGTRAQGGKDYASPRYIFTSVSPLTRLMFPEADDVNLDYEEEDGLLVEPVYYVPVLPNLLINGSYGIGTGWSCYIPPHDPLAVAEHVMRLLRGESIASSPLVVEGKKGEIILPEPGPDSSRLRPWVRGFHGTIHRVNDGRGVTYKTTGKIARTSRTTLEISELPVGLWTDDYKQHLMAMYEAGQIKRFNEYHTFDRVRFEITGTKAQMDALEEPSRRQRGRPPAARKKVSRGSKRAPKHPKEEMERALLERFKLELPMSMRNMHAFDAHGKIAKYDNAEEICEAHFEVRLAAYEHRKDSLLRKFEAEVAMNSNKSRFIGDILSGEIELLRGRGRGEEDLMTELQRRQYLPREAIDGAAGGGGSEAGKGSYRYLLDMPIQSLTEERVVALRKSCDESSRRLQDMQGSSPSDLWARDIEAYAAAAVKLPGASKTAAKMKRKL